MSDFKWFQSKIIMSNGDVLRGIRLTGKNKEECQSRLIEMSSNILENIGVNSKLIKSIEVEEVSSEILSKYNLNNKNDFDRFVNYIDDDFNINKLKN